MNRERIVDALFAAGVGRWYAAYLSATVEALIREDAREALTEAADAIGEEKGPVGAWDNDYTRGRDNGKYVAARVVRAYRDREYPEGTEGLTD